MYRRRCYQNGGLWCPGSIRIYTDTIDKWSLSFHIGIGYMRGGSRITDHLFVKSRYLFLYQPCTMGWNVGYKTKGIADATFYDDIWVLLINYMNGFYFPREYNLDWSYAIFTNWFNQFLFWRVYFLYTQIEKFIGPTLGHLGPVGPDGPHDGAH